MNKEIIIELKGRGNKTNIAEGLEAMAMVLRRKQVKTIVKQRSFFWYKKKIISTTFLCDIKILDNEELILSLSNESDPEMG